MKTRSNKLILWLFSLLLMAATSVSITACHDDDDDKGGGSGKPDTEQTDSISTGNFDDLAVLQEALCVIDSAGDLVRYNIGEALYEAEPQHLYIGVEDATEAEEYFRSWIAPDVQLSSAVPTTTDLTAHLTDSVGNAQGTAYFRLSSGTGVAEVTFSSDTKIKYVDKVTFLLNSAWPFNSGEAKVWHLGDIMTFSPTGDCGKGLDTRDKTLNWVLVREAGNGVKPMWVAITNNDYTCGHAGAIARSDIMNYRKIRTSSYCPGSSAATNISNILKKNWDYFVTRFDAAGSGKLIKDKFYWYDHEHWNWYRFYDIMNYSSGYTYGETDNNKAPFLLKIDWMDDGKVFLKPTAGTDNGDDEGYANLFDGETTTKWCVNYFAKTGDRVDGSGLKCWFVEFENSNADKPTGYYLSTANDTKKYDDRNPRKWRLYGKMAGRNKEWKLLSDVDIYAADGLGLQPANYYTQHYMISTYLRDEYTYYRFEVYETGGSSSHVQLSRFGFDYDGETTTKTDFAVSALLAGPEHVGWCFANNNWLYPTAERATANGKTPLGLVGYVNDGSDFGNAATEANNGGGHVLVMSHNMGSSGSSIRWNTSGSGIVSLTSPFTQWVNKTTGAKAALTDFDGLAKTKALAATGNSTAANSALNFANPAKAPGTGWFLPSAGQWLAMLCSPGLGGMPMPDTSAAFPTYLEQGTTKAYENIASHIVGNGYGSFYYFTPSDEYWSSSAYSPGIGVYLAGGSAGTRLTYYNAGQYAYVRPVFAY